MSEAMEHHEHAKEAAEGGRKPIALLIAVLAASLALADQGAQHAQTHLSEESLATADSWAAYQAKSIRAANARSLADITALLPTPDGTARDALAARLRADATHYETDPDTGKAALARQATGHAAARDESREKLHAFENSAAAFQLAIVLATASVITGAAILAALAAGLGICGLGLAVLGLVAPSLAAF